MTILIANWKMHFGFKEAIHFCANLPNSIDSNKLIIAAPAPYLSFLAQNFPDLKFAAQDVSAVLQPYGPYTGEVSAEMLDSCGVSYAIVGHSERRIHQFENDMVAHMKIQNCMSADIIPIICIGESIESRQSGSHLAELRKQLLSILPSNISTKFIIAYEPLWAIGTGNLPSKAQLQEVYDVIHLTTMTVAQPLAIVYGGSVNSATVNHVMQSSRYCGVLLGSASLNMTELIKVMDII